jgi:hypothetical protein
MSFSPMISVSTATQAPLTSRVLTDHTSGLIRPGRTSREMRFE